MKFYHTSTEKLAKLCINLLPYLMAPKSTKSHKAYTWVLLAATKVRKK